MKNGVISDALWANMKTQATKLIQAQSSPRPGQDHFPNKQYSCKNWFI